LGGARGQEKPAFLLLMGQGLILGGGMPQGTQIKRVYLGLPYHKFKIKKEGENNK